MPAEPIVTSCELYIYAARLLAEIDRFSNIEVVPLTGGGNNRVYRIITNKSTYLLKEYFSHPFDERDRLKAEFDFAKFAWLESVKCIPEPIICDRSRGLGLYSYIEGERISGGEVSVEDINQAITFVVSLNKCRNTQGARALLPGSEACFSIRQHLDVVRRRIDRLSGLIPYSDVDCEALDFIGTKLVDSFQQLESSILEIMTQANIAPETELKIGERVISPSDFGFHNALRRPDSSIVFLDFEYAGWDDPAKLICDFFSQLTVPVPLVFFERFARAVLSVAGYNDSAMVRVKALLPLYRLKWSCIALNYFLPMDSTRKQFAVHDAKDRKREQLEKARGLVDSLKDINLLF